MTVTGKPSIAVIGGANIDIHGKSRGALRQRDSNPGVVHIAPGGVARNVAHDLARLGAHCRLFTVVGNDQYGEMILALGRTAGIDMQCVQQLSTFSTSTYLAILDDSGDMLVAVADMAILNELTIERLQPYRNTIAGASLLVVDTNLPEETLRWLCDSFSDLPIFVDTVSAAKATRIKPHLRYVHTLKTSTIEAEALTGLKAATDAQMRRLADAIHELGVERAFITRGGSGVFYSTGDAAGSMSLGRIPDIVSTSGAGDAFLAGLSHAWIEQLSLDDTLRFALAAAAVTVKHRASSSPALSVRTINNLLEELRVR